MGGGGNGIGELGEVVLVNNRTLEKIFVTTEVLESYTGTHTPIGVVVIPASHDIYSLEIVDNRMPESAGVMALMGMSSKTPETGGTSETTIKFNNTDTELTIKRFRVLNVVSDLTSNKLSTTSQSGGLLPSTIKTQTFTELSADGKAKYSNMYSSSGPILPSPYLADGSRNEVYYSRQLSSENALSDFNGDSNTKNIISELGQDALAAYCCSRFSPLGTNPGDWYIPSCGEFGYVVARFAEINSAISAVRKAFGSKFGCLLVSSGSTYFVSTCQTSNKFYLLSTIYGQVTTGSSTSSFPTRAFTRIRPK